MNSKTKDLARQAIQYATQKGASACICKIASHEQQEFVAEQDDLSAINSSNQLGFGISVHYESKKGSASTNAVHIESIKKTVDQAISLAKFSVADPYLTTTTPKIAPAAPPLPFLFHDGWKTADRKFLAKTVRDGIIQISSHKNISVDRLNLSIDESHEFYINSAGVEQSESQTQASWGLLGMANDGDYVSGMDWTSGFCYTPDELTSKFDATLKDFQTKILRLLKRGNGESYHGPILITPRCIDELFLSIPLSHMSGRAVMDNRSKFSENDHGDYFHSSITLKDDPHDRKLSGATSYDSEGIPTQKKTLIENGKIQGFLCDAYSAGKLKRQPSGISGGPFGLSLTPGDKSYEELIRAAPQLLVVDRFSGNSDFATGSFSGVAKSSGFYSQGEYRGIVEETMVAGNLFDVIKNVLAIEDTAHLTEDSSFYPHILVDGVDVTSR